MAGMVVLDRKNIKSQEDAVMRYGYYKYSGENGDFKIAAINAQVRTDPLLSPEAAIQHTPLFSETAVYPSSGHGYERGRS